MLQCNKLNNQRNLLYFARTRARTNGHTRTAYKHTALGMSALSHFPRPRVPALLRRGASSIELQRLSHAQLAFCSLNCSPNVFNCPPSYRKATCSGTPQPETGHGRASNWGFTSRCKIFHFIFFPSSHEIGTPTPRVRQVCLYNCYRSKTEVLFIYAWQNTVMNALQGHVQK